MRYDINNPDRYKKRTAGLGAYSDDPGSIWPGQDAASGLLRIQLPGTRVNGRSHTLRTASECTQERGEMH